MVRYLPDEAESQVPTIICTLFSRGQHPACGTQYVNQRVGKTRNANGCSCSVGDIFE
jgi:hypothetical protein